MEKHFEEKPRKTQEAVHIFRLENELKKEKEIRERIEVNHEKERTRYEEKIQKIEGQIQFLFREKSSFQSKTRVLEKELSQLRSSKLEKSNRFATSVKGTIQLSSVIQKKLEQLEKENRSKSQLIEQIRQVEIEKCQIEEEKDSIISQLMEDLSNQNEKRGQEYLERELSLEEASQYFQERLTQLEEKEALLKTCMQENIQFQKSINEMESKMKENEEKIKELKVLILTFTQAIDKLEEEKMELRNFLQQKDQQNQQIQFEFQKKMEVKEQELQVILINEISKKEKEFNDQCKDLGNVIEQKNQEVENLKFQEMKLIELLNQKETQLNILNNEKNQLHQHLEASQRQLLQDKEEKGKEKESYLNQFLLAKQQVKQIQNQLQEKTLELESLQANFQALNEEKQKLEKENASLQKKYKIDIDKLKSILLRNELENQEQIGKVNQITKQNQELFKEINQKNEYLIQLEKQKSDLQKENEAQMVTIKVEKQKLTEQIQSLLNENQQLVKINEETKKNNFQQFQKLKQEFEIISSNMKELTLLNDQLYYEKINLESKQLESEATLVEERKEKEKIQNNLIEMEVKYSNVLKDLQESTIEQEKYCVIIENLNSQNFDLSSKYQEQSNNFERALQEIHSQQEIISYLKEENNSFTKSCQDLKQIIHQLQKQNSSLQEIIEKQNQRQLQFDHLLQSKETRIQELIIENQQINSNQEQFISQLQQAREQEKVNQELLGKQSEHIIQLKNEIQSQNEEKMNLLTQERQQHSQTQAQLKTLIEGNKKLQLQIELFQEENLQIISMNQQSQKDLELQKQQNLQLQTTLRNITIEKDQLKAEHQTIQKSIAINVENLKQTCQDQEKEIELLHQKLVDQESIFEEQENEFSKLRHKYIDLESKYHSGEELRIELEKSVHYRAALEELETRNSSLLMCSKTNEEELKRLSQQLAGHQNSKQKIQYVSKLKEENLALHQENQLLKEKLRKFSKRIDNKENTLIPQKNDSLSVTL